MQHQSERQILPPNYKDSLAFQIGWNGFWRQLCEQNPKVNECSVILSLIYDPTIGRLRTTEMSLK